MILTAAALAGSYFYINRTVDISIHEVCCPSKEATVHENVTYMWSTFTKHIQILYYQDPFYNSHFCVHSSSNCLRAITSFLKWLNLQNSQPLKKAQFFKIKWQQLFYFSNLSTLETLDSTNSRHSSQICPWKIHPWNGLTRFPPRPPRRGACCSIRSAAEAGGEAGRMVRQTSYVSSGKGRRLCCLRTAFFCSCSSRSPPSDVWRKRNVQH